MAENTNPLDSYAAKYRKPATGDTESVNPLDAFASKYRKAAQPTPATDGNILSDTATDLKAGVLKTPGMLAGLADIPAGLVGLDRPVDKLTDKIGEATGFTPGKWAEEAQKTGYSPERQQSDQNVQNAWDAYDKGEQTLTGAIGETLSNPRTLLGNTVESLPSMVAGGLGGKALLGAKALAPAIGEGAVMAGQQMDNIDGTVDPQKAAALSLGTGAIGAGLGLVGGKVAQKAGWVDPESAIGGIAQQAVPGKPLSAPARIAGGAASEGLLEELPQSLVEQGAQNIAEDKPLTQDMARSGVQGALAGGLMGGAFNTIKVSPITGEPIPPETETSGPLGDALNAGAVEVQAALPPPAKQLPAPDPSLEFNRSHVPPDANIVFDDGSQTSAYDYFNQRMAEHGNEQKAREETYVALNGKPSPVIGIPELVFLSDGTSLSKADVLRGFMAQGYDEQAANDYLRKIVETPVEERTTVNLDPYRFLQERDANTKAPETAKPDDQNPVTPAETQAAQSEVTPTGDIPTPESTISPQPEEVKTDEKQSTDQSTGQQGQGQEGLLKPFKPTHLLNDGTPVIEGEDSFGKYWQSEDGNQFDGTEPATPVTEDSNEQGQNKTPQATEKKIKAPWESINQDSTRWHGSRVEIQPQLKGDTVKQGTVKTVLKGSSSPIVEVQIDGSDSTYRYSPDQLKVLSVVDNKQSKNTAPQEIPAEETVSQSPALDETLDTTGDKTRGSESPAATTNVPRFVENQSPRWRQIFGVDDAVSFASTPDSFTKDTLGGKPIGHFLSQMHLWEDGYKDLDGRLLKGGAAGHNASAKSLIENWRLYAKAKLTLEAWRSAHPEESANLDRMIDTVRSLNVGDKVLMPDFVRTEQDSHSPEYKEATIVKKNPKNWVVKSSNGVDMRFRPESLRPFESEKPSTVDNKSTETQETDKQDKKTRLKPFNQEALKGDEDALTGMAKTAGWYEVGGQLLRDDQGNVTGRTKWLPKSDWYAEVPTDSRLNESDTVEAVRKAIAGEPMTAKEHRAVQFMLDYMEVMNAGGEEAKLDADLERQAIIDESTDSLDDLDDDDIDLLFASSTTVQISGETLDEQLERIFGPEAKEGAGSTEQADTEGETQGSSESDDQKRPVKTERENTREDYLNDPEFVKFLKSNKTDIDFGSGPVKMTYERGLYKLDKMISQFKGFIACMG